MKKYIKWILFSLALIGFIFLIIEVNLERNFVIDSTTINFITHIRSDILTNIFKVITNLGSAINLSVIAILCYIFIKNKKVSRLILINLAGSYLLNLSMKLITQRIRPIDSLITAKGYSFPSGHSMVSSAFYGFLIYLVINSKMTKSNKILLSILLVFIILLVCFSRIYLGVHYITDVLGSIALATMYLTILITIINKKNIIKG